MRPTIGLGPLVVTAPRAAFARCAALSGANTTSAEQAATSTATGTTIRGKRLGMIVLSEAGLPARGPAAYQLVVQKV